MTMASPDNPAPQAQRVRIEFGRRWVPAPQAATLQVGAVIELDCQADAPVDLFAGGKPVATGAPVVANGKMGVRITEIKT